VRKKDLELGGVYATERGRAHAVLSTRIWKRTRYSKDWQLCPKRVNTPSRGSLWEDVRGILVVDGGTAEELRAFVKDYPDLHAFEVWEKAEPESGKEADRLAKWAGSVARERGLRVSVADYRRWVGTPEEVEAQNEDQRRRQKEDREQAEAKARPIRERAQRLEDSTRRLLGQAEEWGYDRWDYAWMTVGDATESVPDKVKLSVEELERLIEMAERGRTE
jgi:hypothetical protein